MQKDFFLTQIEKLNNPMNVCQRCEFFNKQNKITKSQVKTILDCGSFSNFISSNLVSKLKLKTNKLQTSILVKGISGDTDSINESVTLKFQLKLFIKNQYYFIRFKQNFLVTDHIHVDLLLGSQFMRKFHIHYNYSKNYVYSTLGLNHFKNNVIKSFPQNTKSKKRNPSFNYNFLISEG